MIATACITLYSFLIKQSSGNEAFTNGLALGWAISVIVYSISTAYFGMKEKWEYVMIKNRIKEFRARYDMKTRRFSESAVGVRRND